MDQIAQKKEIRRMRGLSKRYIELIDVAKEILKEIRPASLRQTHYCIFSASVIDYPNTPASYRRLGRALTIARRRYRAWELSRLSEAEMDFLCKACDAAKQRVTLLEEAADERYEITSELDEEDPELDVALDELEALEKRFNEVTQTQFSSPAHSIDPRWITDETREGEMVSVFRDSDHYIETIKRDYRRDLWQTQPNYVEVWSEKATVLASLRPVTYEWGVMLRVCHGFGSMGMESEIGYLFEELADKEITVFYVGDCDSSGRLIDEDMHRRCTTFGGREFTLKRLAIFHEDIKKFNLPPQTIKDTDTRSAGYLKKFGTKESVELDALPPNELRRRVEKAIKSMIDFRLWNQQISTEKMEFDSITRFAEMVKNLPQDAPPAKKAKPRKKRQ
jgi:hypothetical protein